MRFSELRTPGGHRADEVSSAMQKEIRRGREREALYWATELDLAGYGNYVWKRLRLIVSEDVGVAEPMMAVLVRTLYDNWREQLKADKQRRGAGSAGIFLIHAVLALARARKTRMADTAFVVMYEGRRPPLEVPDYALDKHTRRGRELGRGIEHFYEVGAVLANEASEIDDPYYEQARAIDEARRQRAAEPREHWSLDLD